MQIIFINRYFYPDLSATSQLLSDQAFELARCGFNVAVIASRHGYADGKRLSAFETVEGVSIYRVWTSSFGRFRLLGRAIDSVIFFVTATWRLMLTVRRGDIVVTKTDPPLFSIVSTAICTVSGAKSVNWLQDIFPEIAQRLGVGRGRFAGGCHAVMRMLRDRALRSADASVVLGPTMRGFVEGLGVASARIHEIPNWADGASIRPLPAHQNRLRAAWGLRDDFVVGYSDNLGRAHEHEIFADAVELLERRAADRADRVAQARPSDCPSSGESFEKAGAPAKDAAAGRSIRWLFIGGGINYEALQRSSEARSLDTVVFKEYQDRALLCESLNCADVHLVTLRPELEGLIVPSKVYGCMATGRPVIFIGSSDGEVGTLVQKYQCGIVIEPGDAAGLADAVAALAADPNGASAMGLRARQAFESEFDERHARERWKTLVTGLGAHVVPSAAVGDDCLHLEANQALASHRARPQPARNRSRI